MSMGQKYLASFFIFIHQFLMEYFFNQIESNENIIFGGDKPVTCSVKCVEYFFNSRPSAYQIFSHAECTWFCDLEHSIIALTIVR